jgi:PTS system cellobiose-specific IIC component
MPSPLGAAWSANGSWKNMCMCLFAIFNAWMLYRPFFKVHERQLMQLEQVPASCFRPTFLMA